MMENLVRISTLPQWGLMEPLPQVLTPLGQQWSWSYLWWRGEVDDRWLLSGVDDRSSILDLGSIRVLWGSVRL